jgi:hypothetical protein
MSKQIIEEYEIPRVGSFTIYKGQFSEPEAAGLSIMHNGCGVGGSKITRIEDARRFIHDYATADLLEQEQKLSVRLAEIRSAYVRLKSDVWNLGLFMTKHQEVQGDCRCGVAKRHAYNPAHTQEQP